MRGPYFSSMTAGSDSARSALQSLSASVICPVKSASLQDFYNALASTGVCCETAGQGRRPR